MFRRLMCDVQEAYITKRPSHVAAYKLLLCCSFIVISIFCCNITHKRSIIVYSISHEPELDRHDRQRSDSTGRTVLQTVAQKSGPHRQLTNCYCTGKQRRGTELPKAATSRDRRHRAGWCLGKGYPPLDMGGVCGPP